ncbi:MAG: BamA/TamA family outer membrane protein [Flavobacteriales bacterium]
MKKHRVVIHSEEPPANDSIGDLTMRYKLGISKNPEGFSVPSEDIIAFSKLKPNKRVVWARFNLGIYTLVPKRALDSSSVRAAERCVRINEKREKKGKEPKKCQSMWMWMANTIGEKPAELDSTLMIKSAEQMSIYLQKKGYFDNKIIPEVVYKNKGLIFWRKGAKTKVRYHVYPSQPYRYRNIDYNIQDSVMAHDLNKIVKGTLLDSLDVFDLDILDGERERISTHFNNTGYYEFTKDYITYDARKDVVNHLVDMKLQLIRPQIPSPEYPDSLISVPHKKYFIGEIYVHTNFDASNPKYAPTDTMIYDGLNIIYSGEPNLTKELISCLKGYDSGSRYNRELLDKTYKRYSQLGVLRATSIQIVPRPESVNGIHILDTHIRLTPLPRQYFRIEPQVTHRSGNMGIYGNLLYSSRNIFKGAETLDARMILGLEASQTLVETANTDQGQNIERSFRLNTFEIGPELTYRVPRLWPLGCDHRLIKKSSEPQTSLGAGFNYQSRPDYVRTLSQLRFSWNWIENPDKVTRIAIDFPEFSVIKIQKSVAFQEFLDNLNDEFLANSYRDHLILATNFTWTLNSQKNRNQRRYFFFKSNISLAGNSLYGLMKMTGAPLDEAGSYEIAGIRFANYTRGELDFRYYSNVNEKNTFVLRAYGGLGLPYWNLNVLPFEKSFFSGGSNGMRAWQARTLGPGSSRDSSVVRTFNNIGEVKLEGNFEYRFKMTRMLNWAIFIDAGNIWLNQPSLDKVGADFTSKRFVSEIAIGSGIGLRLDFDIFLVRFDLGIKLKDPSKVPGERWSWQPKNEYLSYLQSINSEITKIPTSSNVVLNLGIGFPF